MPIRVLGTLLLFFLAACQAVPATPSPYSDADLQLRRQLDELVLPHEIIADQQTLEKVLAFLAEQNNVQILVNWRALRDQGVEKSTPISLQLRAVSLAACLKALLSQVPSNAPLDYDASAGSIRISTKADLESTTSLTFLRLRYDVHDLISRPTLTGTTDPNRRMAYLMNLIAMQVDPRSWRMLLYPGSLRAPAIATVIPLTTDKIYPGDGSYKPPTCVINDDAEGYATMSAFGDSLIISQTAEVHAQIAALLSLLRGQKPLNRGLSSALP